MFSLATWQSVRDMSIFDSVVCRGFVFLYSHSFTINFSFFFCFCFLFWTCKAFSITCSPSFTSTRHYSYIRIYIFLIIRPIYEQLDLSHGINSFSMSTFVFTKPLSTHEANHVFFFFNARQSSMSQSSLILWLSKRTHYEEQ